MFNGKSRLSGKDHSGKHSMKEFKATLFDIFSEENHCALLNRRNLKS